MTKNENIKAMYDQAVDKTDLIEKVAAEFKIKESSVRSNWFSKFDIPERYNVQDNLIAYMQKYIANQNKVSV